MAAQYGNIADKHMTHTGNCLAGIFLHAFCMRHKARDAQADLGKNAVGDIPLVQPCYSVKPLTQICADGEAYA